MRAIRRKALGVMVALAVGGLALTALSGGDRWGTVPTPAPEPEKPAEPKLVLWAPNDGVAAALADLLTVPEYERFFLRYVFIPDADMRTVRNVSWTINLVSRASIIYLPTVLAGGHLVRYDVRRYCRSDEDVAEWLRILEDFRYDTNFSLDITKDMLEFAERLGVHVPPVKVTRRREVVEWREEKNAKIVHAGGELRYPDDSGRVIANCKAGTYRDDLRFKVTRFEEYTEEVNPLLEGSDVIIRQISGGINPDTLSRLEVLAHTEAPIVSARYFLSRARGTIKSKNSVFDTAFGGRYYDLRGIKKSKRKGQTDQDRFFEEFLGIGNFKGQLTARRLFDSLQSDHRYLILNSEVAGHKNRIVVDYPTLAGYEGGMLTLDVQDENVDVSGQALNNLADRDLTFDAQEAIFPDAKKMPMYLLWNGQGDLQEEAPFNVVSSRNHPSPYTTRLHAADCVDCHAASGSDGWLPVHNDALDFIGFKLGQADVFSDFHDRRHGHSVNYVNRLAGQYAGQDTRERLQRLRMDFMTSTLNACGGMFEGSDGSQADVGKLNAQWLVRQYARENYTTVGAKEALEDLGLEEGTHYPAEVQDPTTGKKLNGAVTTFQALVLPDTRNPPVDGFLVETGTVAVLRSGKRLPPSQWFFTRPFVAERARAGVETLRKAAQK